MLVVTNKLFKRINPSKCVMPATGPPTQSCQNSKSKQCHIPRYMTEISATSRVLNISGG